MFRKNILCVSAFTMLPLFSFASQLIDCEYYSTKILKISADSGASCGEKKLCTAEILCTKAIKTKSDKAKSVDVTRNIVCPVDVATGKCPSVETCRKDKTLVYENEVETGEAGKDKWAGVVANLTPALMSMYLGQKYREPFNSDRPSLGYPDRETKEESGSR